MAEMRIAKQNAQKEQLKKKLEMLIKSYRLSSSLRLLVTL
jgi:t-SNARE complex subunit (syntaxin)